MATRKKLTDKEAARAQRHKDAAAAHAAKLKAKGK